MKNATPTSIYKYYDEYGVLIYVGITGGGIRRQRAHNNDKIWWQYVAGQTVEHHESREAALSRESLLIATHQPPFNTQHNPAHKSALASYEAFRRIPGLDRSPIDIVQEIGREIPLMMVSREGSTLVLGTPLKFAPLTTIIEADHKLRVIAGTVKCGRLESVRARGASLEFILDVRGYATVLDPFVRLGIVMNKTGATFNARNIQISKHNPPTRSNRASARIQLQDEASK